MHFSKLSWRFCVLGNKCGENAQCSATDALTGECSPDAVKVKRNMKIQKDKQMSTTHLLKHTSATAASTATAQNAQTPFPRGPLGSKDQIRVLGGGQTNHCMAHAKHPRMGEVGTSTASISPCAPSSPLNSEEDDGGGGRWAKKKKKRKKKDKRGEPGGAWQHKGLERDMKPKKKREQKAGKELLLCNSKEPRKVKEVKVKAPKEVKRGRKPKVQALLHPPAECKSAPSPPRQRGCKPRAQVLQGPVPVEKKKKGKRKSEAVLQTAGETDNVACLSALAMGGEESIDPLDNTKRRSGRQVKRRKYNEDLDFKVVDDDGETIAVLGTGRIPALNAATLAWQAEEPPEDEANIIEKILSVRNVKKEASPEETTEELEEFYVKYRNFSYLHCKWATLEELEKDPRIHQKIKRFRTKQAQIKHIFVEPNEDLFNPDYIEVDRVLEVAITTDTETGEEVTHYLVKWCSLSYEEATWELQEDVDPVKIREFEDIKRIPEFKFVERPQPDKWQKLDRSKDYRSGNQLREYQLEGMNWLLFNWYNRKNCILADEMGLGKTIQSITFLFEMFSMGLRGPFLIIAPLSTITNWEREFRTWTEINVIVYHGSQISRQMIHQYEMYHKDQQGNIVLGGYKFHGVITTFEMIMADCPELKKIHWRCVIIDEAHRLKNRNCKLLEGLKLMNLEHKVLLTGTPLQNSVEELFSLLNFLEPLQFPSESLFLEEFGDLKTEEQVKKLQAILKPMMLRRLKDDVEKNLAPKEETIIEVELTNMQKKYYRAILEKNFTFLAKGANQHNMPNLINTMMELRKCCNHPYLIKGAEEKILDSFRKTHSPDAWDFQLQAMIQAAGKLVLIDKLLPKLIAGGHKVLVFSQMVRCLDILEDYLIQRRYTYERIDGRVRGNLRQAAIDRFCKVDSDRFVFLLCTRAGGLGINLTAADTCIIFDSDWNPQNDLQAQARCHRIGQSKAVKVYRLITRNSYEREMFDKASLKLGLDKAVLQDINRKGSLNGAQQMTKIEVEDLLRKGAYGALMDEEDEGSKFCEEDIDQILQRRTQTITIETEGKGSTFAKASFVSSGNRTDISLDDPNFWQKWAKIAELEIDSKAEKESLVIDTPRVRKQTRHYNSFEDDELMEFSELDSDSEERPCRTRRFSERNRRYLRAECFRVEKNLLIFGWGRWKDILTHGRFKWQLSERDMEVLCRALLVYCLRHYKGDDKIKSFIWDLITPAKDGHKQDLQNHSGLSAPVPRGRKGKKLKNQLSVPEMKHADWLVNCNPEVVLQDDSYKKHLKQHCNKVLLRVRMLYYLKAEVLGETAAQSLEGIPASKLEVALPDIDYIEIPAGWWDAEADKSLLIGVHKHGYERYNAMRADPELCFLERVGMPDVTALSAEQSGGEVVADLTDSACKSDDMKDNPECNPEEGGVEKVDNKDETSSSNDAMDKHDSVVQDTLSVEMVKEGFGQEGFGQEGMELQGRPLWPAGPALTARLRRLITAYQRFMRREPLRHDFLLPEGLGSGLGPMSWQLGEEIRRCTVAATEPDPLFLEWQRRWVMSEQRWTRREQADFYRTVSSFGVVHDLEKKTFDWSLFRSFARLERKTDESLERYFSSFVSMCRTACRLPPRKDEASVVDSYVEVAQFAAPMSMCEMPDSLQDTREPTIAQLLQEKALYSFSEWPKDRVIINRLDSICHAILKGKWPSSIQQYDSPSSLENTYVPNSVHQSAGVISARVQPSQRLNFNIPAPPVTRLPKYKSRNAGECSRGGWRLTSLPLLQERLVAPPYLPELKRGRRAFEYEAEVVSKQYHTGEKMPVTLSNRGGALLLNGWQEAAMDLSKAGDLGIGGEAAATVGHMSNQDHPGAQKLPAMGAMQSAMQGSVGMDMAGILQAGLIHPVTGQIVNGNLRCDDAIMRRRRGRRRNVEAVDIGFVKSRGMHVPEQQGRVEVISHSAVSSTSSPPERPPGTSTPTQSEVVAIDREAANKSLMEWLRQNPNYNMEVPTFAPSPGAAILHSFVERPKQRRHRCKDPTKLDVNSLTGEERVPVVHRGTGRRLGGAMAPAIKELSRWLDANTEYCVAPDWADVVKHSGFLPEGKFTRILTEPVCRDQGPRRRGRRPRGEMPKPLLSESPMGPLFMNGGLIGSMDLVSLQNLHNVQGIPLTGLMGFPHGFAVSAGEDAKNGLSMLPMMLHGIHGAPHMFSVQGLKGQPPTCSATTTSSLAAVTTTTASSSAASSPSRGPSQASSSTGAEGSGIQPGTERKREDKQQGAMGSHSIAAITTTAATSSSSGVGSSSGSHLAFNPFLVPGMSHGLLYPHMFLPHGGIMALPGMPPADSSGSPKRKKRTREEGVVVVEEAGRHSHLQTDSGPPKKPSDGQTGESTADQAGPEAREQMEDNIQEEGTGHDSHDPPEVNPKKSVEEERGSEENSVIEEEKLPEEERESRGAEDSQ
ncbi:chromodomain-helicase-DNA-binding protein 6-like isoform X7 [Coregonus clupeaformis]|uniref:chromodomain-helicase-DNA-binding protein 6-like isoform X7 n=1 Tax=Coregonus clupeaformis TaxID=59861 RepID=UPI001E1C6B70|nr:chromodomain-helicase-DNA-binding protein 6-like isoform X7 [Coregonus clupeaformis]